MGVRPLKKEYSVLRDCVFFSKNDTEEPQPLDFVLGLSKWQKSNLYIILQTFYTGHFSKFSKFPVFLLDLKMGNIQRRSLFGRSELVFQ